MKLSRREFLAVSAKASAGLGLGVVLSACAPSATPTSEAEPVTEVEPSEEAPPPEKIELRFMYDATPGETAWHEKTKPDFEALHPNIEIRPEATVEQWADKLIAAIVGGTAPDLIVSWVENFVNFASRGAYMDITHFVKSWPDFDDFWPGAIKECTFEGKIYGVNYCFDPCTLYFYNEILLEEAGIPYPDDTWTYDDFKQRCIALTKKDDAGNVIQWGFNGAEAVANWGWTRAFPTIYAFGGRKYNDDMTHCMLAEPEALEAINLFWELKIKHQASPTPAQMGDMNYFQQFASGLVGYQTTGPWALSSYREMISDPELKERWEVGPPPTGPAGRFIWGAGNNWGIWKGTKHPDEAMVLLQFLTDAERAKQMASIANRVPARKSAADAFGDPNLRPDNQSLIPQTLEYAISPPLHPTRGQEISDVINAAWERLMILEEGTPEEVMSEAVEKVDEILAEG